VQTMTEQLLEKLLDEYLSEEQLAEELRVGKATVAGWRKKQIGPAYTEIGRRIYYRRGGALEWMRRREKTSSRRTARRETV